MWSYFVSAYSYVWIYAIVEYVALLITFQNILSSILRPALFVIFDWIRCSEWLFCSTLYNFWDTQRWYWHRKESTSTKIITLNASFRSTVQLVYVIGLLISELWPGMDRAPSVHSEISSSLIQLLSGICAIRTRRTVTKERYGTW